MRNHEGVGWKQLVVEVQQHVLLGTRAHARGEPLEGRVVVACAAFAIVCLRFGFAERHLSTVGGSWLLARRRGLLRVAFAHVWRIFRPFR